jgi:hypothetical protein
MAQELGLAGKAIENAPAHIQDMLEILARTLRTLPPEIDYLKPKLRQEIAEGINLVAASPEDARFKLAKLHAGIATQIAEALDPSKQRKLPSIEDLYATGRINERLKKNLHHEGIYSLNFFLYNPVEACLLVNRVGRTGYLIIKDICLSLGIDSPEPARAEALFDDEESLFLIGKHVNNFVPLDETTVKLTQLGIYTLKQLSDYTEAEIYNMLGNMDQKQIGLPVLKHRLQRKGYQFKPESEES